MAFLIEHFPDDILANILSQPGASDMVVSMWLCGNHTLNARLSRAGCTSFVASVVEVLKWPRMLSELKSLRQVSIRAELFRERLFIVCEEVLKLPRDLEVLELDFPGSSGMLFDKYLASGSRFAPTSPYGVLADWFPDLQSLTVENKVWEERYHYYEAREIAALPRCLKSLRLGCIMPTIDSIDILPPELTRLRFPGEHRGDRALLPRTLTQVSMPLDASVMHHLSSLTTLDFESSDLSKDVISSLPRALTHLQLRAEVIDDAVFAAAWPTTLTSLDCMRLTAAQLPQLPQTLRYLEVGKLVGFAQQIADLPVDRVVALWPKHLTSLTFKTLFTISVDNLNTLPPSLTSIKKVEIDINTDSKAVTFPQHWKHLEFSCSLVSDVRGLVHLPPQLESLAGEWKLFTHLVRDFPSTLLSLRIASSVSDEYLQCLPSGLTDLNLAHFNHTLADPLRYLPRTLRTLTIQHLDHDFRPKDYASLPRSLRSLSILNLTAKFESFIYIPITICVFLYENINEINAKFAYQIPHRWLEYIRDRTREYDEIEILAAAVQAAEKAGDWS